eukprot:gnl/MRDRNA2_/MRDRNA2_62305_c0_seq1.p1 gnl/MRDRNA2_/MRDRNA2_62305_c0~~gnl/MRDRNA2_/MRDRNA2_62305_c0_seq1.p1  ORF type:complete len:1357 (+),score=241.70 gnl/MRDRNA2_/MRDRNA2_62305_c0_seq1:92-4072(+)
MPPKIKKPVFLGGDDASDDSQEKEEQEFKVVKGLRGSGPVSSEVKFKTKAEKEKEEQEEKEAAEKAETDQKDSEEEEEEPENVLTEAAAVGLARKGSVHHSHKKRNCCCQFIHRARQCLRHFVHGKFFETCIMLCIGASFTLMTLESPVDDTYSPTKNETVWMVNFVIVCVFTGEMVLKILATGLWFGEGAYLKVTWHYLDVVVVLISWAEIVFGDDFPFPWMKSLRAIRALRPLRMAAKVPQLRCCIDAVFAALPASIHVITILWIFVSMFAICGVQLFAGSYSRCSDDCVLYREDCKGFFDPNLPIGVGNTDKECQMDIDKSPSNIFVSTHEGWGSVSFECLTAAKLVAEVEGSDGPQSEVFVAIDDSEPLDVSPGNPYVRHVYSGSHQVRLTGTGFWRLTLRGSEGHCGFQFASGGLSQAYQRSVDVCPALADECTGDRSVPSSWPGAEPRVWYRAPWHFDNYFAALLALYEVATLEGWVDIMYRGNDIVGPDIGPCRDASPYSAVFFLVHILVCSFFALNLFVSVVIQKFQDQITDMQMHHKSGYTVYRDCESEGDDVEVAHWSLRDAKLECSRKGYAGFAFQGHAGHLHGRKKHKIHFKSRINVYSAMETPPVQIASNQRWTCYLRQDLQGKQLFMANQMRSRFKRIHPTRLPRNCVSVFLRVFIAQSRLFDRFITFLIALNILLMCTDSAGEDFLDRYRPRIDMVMLGIFGFEAVVKLIGLGLRCYFEDGWNSFDFLIVAASAVALAAMHYLPDFPKEVFVVIKVFRSFRMARVLRKMPGVGPIVMSIFESFSSTTYVAMLLILCFFIYSLGAIALFGRIPDGDILGDNMNFRSFPRAVLTLYYLATGEYWNGLMHDIIAPPACFPIKLGKAPNWHHTWDGETADISGWMHATLCEEDMTGSGKFDGSCCPADLWGQKHYGAIPFFLTYMLLTNFILMNVVVGFVLDSYGTQIESTEKGLSMDDYDEFLQLWNDFDVAQTGFMHVSMLCMFVASLPDKPFKMFHASEHQRTTMTGMDNFRESDIVLLSNLHALVLPGDVVQVFHVFIAFMYLHHPQLLPEEVMDSEMFSGYLNFRLQSGLSICAAEGLTKTAEFNNLYDEKMQQCDNEPSSPKPEERSIFNGLSFQGLLFTDLVITTCRLQCHHLRETLPMRKREAKRNKTTCPMCPEGVTECKCLIREPTISGRYCRRLKGVSDQPAADFKLERTVTELTSSGTRGSISSINSDKKKSSKKKADLKLSRLQVVALIPKLPWKRRLFRASRGLDRLEKDANGRIKDTPSMFWHAQVERAKPQFRDAIIDAILVAQEHGALPEDWNSAFAR